MKEMKVLSHEADSLTGEYRRRVNARKKRYTEICMQTLSELRPAGRPGDLRLAAFALFGMMNWIYNWYHPDRDVTVTELAEGMSKVFLEGYLSGLEAVAGPVIEHAPGEANPSIWRR